MLEIYQLVQYKYKVSEIINNTVNMSSSNISTEDFTEDKDAKKKLVIETIAKESIPHLSEAIKDGSSKLDATILSGGITNYGRYMYVYLQN